MQTGFHTQLPQRLHKVLIAHVKLAQTVIRAIVGKHIARELGNGVLIVRKFEIHAPPLLGHWPEHRQGQLTVKGLKLEL